MYMPPELNNSNWIQSIVSNIDPMDTYIEVNENQEVNYINKDEYELSYNNTLNKLNKKSKENIVEDNILKKEMTIDNQIKELKLKKKENEKIEKEKKKKKKK